MSTVLKSKSGHDGQSAVDSDSDNDDIDDIDVSNNSNSNNANKLPFVGGRDESELWEYDDNLAHITNAHSHSLASHSDSSSSIKSLENFDYSLEDAISYLGLGKFQWIVMLLAGSVWFCAAIQLMLTSVLLLEIQDTLASFEKSLLAAVPFAGEIFGASFISMFGDRYGRKKAILVSALSLAFFGTMSCLSYDFYMLIVCRLMCGCAVGGSLTCLSLVTEFIPFQHRGEMTYVEVSFWSIGAIYAVAVGWLMWSIGLGWRWYLASCAAPSWVAVALAFFIPESPRWLLNNGEYIAVKQLLRRVAVANEVNFMCLKGNLIESDAIQSQKKGDLGSIFNAQHRRTSIQAFIATFCACGAYFGIALFQLQYFEDESDSTNDVFWELILCTASELPGMVIGIIIFDMVGRIPFLTVTFAVSTLCFVGLIFAGNSLGIALIFLARMCISTAYNILIVYMLEYYPTTIRATALGVAITLARVSGIASSYVAEDLSTSNASIIFSVLCAVATVSVVLFPVETLGRQLCDDDEDELLDMDHQYVEQTLHEFDRSQINNELAQLIPNKYYQKHTNINSRTNHGQQLDETQLCKREDKASQSAFF